jgi:hypothetical protein
MSWIDDIIDFGSAALDFLGGNSIGGQLARTALTGYALNKVTSSINKENQTDKTKTVDPGVRLQIDPNTDYSIPLVYGEANLGGAVTDAVLTNGNMSMFYCLTICEKTGNTILGQGPLSQFTFKDIYWDDTRLIFQSDGVTVAGFIDKANNICTDFNGKIKIWCYDGNSLSPQAMLNYPVFGLPNANEVMPGWTSNHLMSDLVFAIIRVDYDSVAGVRGLGNVKFNIVNSLTQPGDCLFDYMTNTRYGAGIDATEIYAS